MGGWDDFANGFTSAVTLGGCNTSGCGSGHNDSVVFAGNSPLNIDNPNSPLNPGSIIKEILSSLAPLLEPFMMIIGVIILLPILFDLIFAMI